jgi:3-dehydroquinate dehydratase type I
MSNSGLPFPLQGVIGIIDESAEQLDQALSMALKCVEIRADLLLYSGFTEPDLLALVEQAKHAGLATLFTYRHADQGGRFTGDETQRIQLCSTALERGADIIDLEHGTESSKHMLSQSVPIILSYHNFERMLTASELQALSFEMEAQQPSAVKIIPTGHDIADAAVMLGWVANAKTGIKRIGFTMGEKGACSRILTIAHGSPISYASFGLPVAPGQVDISLMIHRYGCMQMSDSTSIVAVVGQPEKVEAYIADKRQQHSNQNASTNIAYVGFANTDQALLEQQQATLKISNIINLSA